MECIHSCIIGPQVAQWKVSIAAHTWHQGPTFSRPLMQVTANVGDWIQLKGSVYFSAGLSPL